jgi:hypothetical protein
MPRVAYDAETTDHALDLYCLHRRNMLAVFKALKDEGYMIARSTLSQWQTKYHWKERAAEREAEARKAADNRLSVEDKMIGSLLARKAQYDKYFETAKIATDPNRYSQSIIAYTNLCKSIIEVSRRKPPEAPDGQQGPSAPAATLPERPKPVVRPESPEDLVRTEEGLVVRIIKFSLSGEQHD